MKSLWGNDDFSLGHDDFALCMVKQFQAIEAILMKIVFFETINLFVACAFAVKTSHYSDAHNHPCKCNHQFFLFDH